MFTTVFTEADEVVAEQGAMSIDWLRELDQAVLDTELGPKFTRQCPKAILRLCHAAWTAVRCDLEDSDVCAHLECVATGGHPPPMTRLRELVSRRPLGLFGLLRYVVGEAPTQMSHDKRPRLPHVVSEVFVPRAAAEWAAAASADPRQRRLAADDTAVDHDLYSFKISELLHLASLALQGESVLDGAKADLDVFGALVYSCLSTNYALSSRASEFTDTRMCADFESTGAPVLAVWNLLLRACERRQPLHRAVSALYGVLRPVVLDWRKLRGTNKVYLHVQMLVFMSVAGYLLLPATCPVLRDGAGDVCGMAPPALCRDLALVPPQVEAFCAGLLRVARGCEGLPSYRRLVVETLSQLPAVITGRSMCNFSNRKVASEYIP